MSQATITPEVQKPMLMLVQGSPVRRIPANPVSPFVKKDYRTENLELYREYNQIKSDIQNLEFGIRDIYDIFPNGYAIRSKEEEKKQILEKVVRQNSPLYREQVRRFSETNIDVSYEDAESTARKTMIRAWDKWDPSRGQFSTLYLKALKHQFNQDHAYANRQIRKPTGKIIRIHDTTKDEENNAYALTSSEYSPLEKIELEENIALLRKGLKTLDPREKKVIQYRFLNGSKEDLKVIGNKMGVSRERIRQLEVSGLSKLREYLERSSLRTADRENLQLFQELLNSAGEPKQIRGPKQTIQYLA